MDSEFSYKVHTERKEIERLLKENRLEYESILKRSKELDKIIIRYLKDQEKEKEGN
ncbi:MAG: hypothetical protein ACOYVD_06455 [Bacillota bacterium]